MIIIKMLQVLSCYALVSIPCMLVVCIAHIMLGISFVDGVYNSESITLWSAILIMATERIISTLDRATEVIS